jgi:hypothetical protein
MQKEPNKVLIYQFVNLYYNNFYGLLAKIHYFLEEYHSLMFKNGKQRYFLENSVIEYENELNIGDKIPPFLKYPFILTYNIDENLVVNELSKQIHNDLLFIYYDQKEILEERIVVEIKHILSNENDKG